MTNSTNRELRALEDYLRQELACRGEAKTEASEEMRLFAEGALAWVDTLQAHYRKTTDSVCVWDAIMQIDFAQRVLNRPVVLPPWVLAYLISAAVQIMGRGVGYPAGDRLKPNPPTKNSDGTTTHHSDHFRGLTPPQRRHVVLEALGFKGPKGRNLLENAHRELNRRETVRKVDALRRQGLSITAAADKVLPPEPEILNPVQKIRRDRQKLRGQK
jgi:hypothetical protein